MKKIVILILVILPMLCIGQAKKLYRQANRATDDKQKIELLNQVIALEPKHFDAYFYRGIAKNNLGDYHGAILDYTKIIIYKPDADSYFNRGNSKYNLQDYLGAKIDYENALKLDPQFIDAQYNLANTKYYLEDYIGAVIDLTKIIDVVPSEYKFYTQRAHALLALEKYKLALKDFSLAILINPNTETYYNRGVAHLNINYYKQAKIDFDKSLDFDANNASSYFFRGTSHLLLGEYIEAISDFKATLKYNASDYEALLGLALTHYKLNDLKNAKLNLKKAENLLYADTNKPLTVEAFANTYWYKNQFYFFKQNFNALNKI
ncbi:tetratricopeptide repeat protein [Hwangdonia lutea]|uniref:Tetratricopeptide repeat protein n=1 Tax=Hwangdonia lutea TaxID=3075823 RepID=A0AA97EIZ6_9FLAO|nr:tetratricopeptide repeat protein [Hwangdonia sp. SCSIO 19198]WOD42326.1 tetratricopeptide repeat protein [Hwangdonia sp. SCSIO 19198]